MKKINYKSFLLAIILLSTISCEDFLDVQNDNLFTPETLLSDPNGMGQLINGIYNGFGDAPGGFDYRFGQFHYTLPGTDLAFDRLGAGAWRRSINTFDNDGTHPNIPRMKWTAFQGITGRANVALSVIPESNLTEEQKLEAEAEVRFLRAFAYFDGVRTWGELPIAISAPATVDEALNVEETAGERKPVQEVFEQVIFPDFLFAVENLPNEERLPGTPTAWAARGMLAKAYMQAAGQFGIVPEGGGTYWQLAIPLLQEIIAGPFSLTPGSNYSELYDVNFEAVNPEKIWVIKYDRDIRDGFATRWFGIASINDPARNPYPPTNTVGGVMNIQVYEEFYNSFDENDIRRDIAIRDYTENLTVDGVLQTADRLWPWGVNKYNFDEAAFSTNGQDGIDRIQIRLADVYLLLAEAINEANGVPNGEAFAAINEVRRRAGIADIDQTSLIEGHFTYGLGAQNINTQEGFRLAILRERAWELCFESHRRFDLNRHGYLDDVALNRWNPPGSEPVERIHYPDVINSFVPGREIFPLPNDQVTLNGWQQNPGY